MSTSSTQSKGINRRIDSIQSNGRPSRGNSYARKPLISHNDAYLYALRVAYLAYLLQPRSKRIQHVPAPPAPVQRSSISVNELVKDLSHVRDSKSTRFPHGFMQQLEKRLQGVVMGTEKKPEYADSAVKRSFAAFYNAFSEPSFKKRMEKDRKVEDLVLIFFSNATKELAKGKSPADDAWKSLVDRHLALFVRLVSLVLKDHDWARDRPELSSRLVSLESRLLSNDQDLSSAPVRNGVNGGSTIEVLVPLTHEVKDMPLVHVVGRIFGLRNTMMQSDINKYKAVWTEKAALQDLKTYQTHLNMNSKRTLRVDDFDLDEAYEEWKRAEVQDITHMMLAICQAYPELKNTSSGVAQFKPAQTSYANGQIPQYPDTLRRTDSKEASAYVVDQPVDMSDYSSGSATPDSQSIDSDELFTFIPLDTRGHYKLILSQALTTDLNENASLPSANGDGSQPNQLLSKSSLELLSEIALRWRLPHVSRMTLFLEAVRDKFVDQEISLEQLDVAFALRKEPLPEKAKGAALAAYMLQDRNRWPLMDMALNQQVISDLHMALLRDLFETMQHCYEQKPPSAGPLVVVLDEHIYGDPSFSETPEKMAEYRNQLHEGLTGKAYEIYREFLQREVPNDQHAWAFVHVIDLGKAVVNILHKIQKRYRNNPEIMG